MLLSLVPAGFVAGQSVSPAAVSEPPRQLVIEVEIPAPVSEVWKAFTTSEGLSTWLFPNATVDLKPGGDWLVHFPGGSTGGGGMKVKVGGGLIGGGVVCGGVTTSSAGITILPPRA